MPLEVPFQTLGETMNAAAIIPSHSAPSSHCIMRFTIASRSWSVVLAYASASFPMDGASSVRVRIIPLCQVSAGPHPIHETTCRTMHEGNNQKPDCLEVP